MTHILSEADHRLNHAQPWAAQRPQTLRGGTGQRVHPLDVSDDRRMDLVPGQRADAPLYVPAITSARASVGRRGWLYGGDGKMGALQTRAFLQAGGDTANRRRSVSLRA